MYWSPYIIYYKKRIRHYRWRTSLVLSQYTGVTDDDGRQQTDRQHHDNSWTRRWTQVSYVIQQKMCIICLNCFYTVECTHKRHYTMSSFFMCPTNCSCFLHCCIQYPPRRSTTVYVLLAAWAMKLPSTWKAIKINNSKMCSRQKSSEHVRDKFV